MVSDPNLNFFFARARDIRPGVEETPEVDVTTGSLTLEMVSSLEALASFVTSALPGHTKVSQNIQVKAFGSGSYLFLAFYLQLHKIVSVRANTDAKLERTIAQETLGISRAKPHIVLVGRH